MGRVWTVGLWGALLLVACSEEYHGLNQTQGSPAGAGSAGARLVGSVHGGQQPIVGARVHLLAAGRGGYGQGSVSLLTAGAGSDSVGEYVTTDASGGFSITGDYTCTAGTQVYIYALGGDPGAGTNSAAGLMAALGNCPVAGVFPSSLFISVNEVSTVAAAYAVAGFATDATHVSSSGTALALTGIANAFANAANLADLSTGAALATTPAGNGTVPQAEINTLANILAACVNSTGPASAGCSTLFGNALSGGTTGTVPTDTATAAINIAHNPVANVANLFALASGAPPFAPGLGAASNDWTVAIAYTTLQPDSSGTGASLGQLAIDGQGNVWIVNLQTTSLNTAPSVSELSSNGTILSGAAGFTGGGLGGSTNTAGGIAIDLSGNVWVSNGYYFDGGVGLPLFEGLALTEFSSSGTPMSGASGYTTGCGGKGLAIDGLGNVWTSAGKCDSSGNYLFPVPTPAPQLPNYPNEAWYISIDTFENAWYSGWTQITRENAPFLYQGGVWKLSNSGTMLYQTLPYDVLLNRDGFDMALSVANDNAGNAWVVAGPYDVRPTGIYELNSGGTTIFTPSITTATFPLDGPVAIDGAGNAWVGNDGFSLLNSIGLVEVSNSGTTLSGTTGFMTEQPPPGRIYGFVSVSGLGVDGSGNVWEALSRYPFVLQYVGIATPVVTPLSVGVEKGTLATRP